MADYTVSELITGYRRDKDSGRLEFVLNTISGSAGYRHQTKIAKSFAAFSDRVSSLVAYTGTRSYGIFFLCFGLLSLILHFIKDYLGMYEDVPLWILVSGALFALFSIPFLVSDKPLFTALQSFALTDYVLFEFFCMKRMQNDEEKKGIHTGLMVLFALLLSCIGAFVPLWWIIALIVGFWYVYFTLMSPEFSFLSMFLALPFLSEVGVDNALYLTVLVLLTAVSFFRKVSLGKRVHFLEQYDGLIAIFVLLILVSGYLFGVGADALAPIYMAALAFGYTLTSCLVANRRLADCVVNAIVISSVPVSVLGIVDFVGVVRSVGFAGFNGISRPFTSTSSLAAYLIVCFIFAIYARRSSSEREHIAVYTVVLLLISVNLVLTLSIPALVALLLAALAYPVTRLRRFSGLLSALIAILPYSVVFIPPHVADMLDKLPVISRLDLPSLVVKWRTAMSLILDNIFVGTGVGDAAFRPEFIGHGGLGQDSSNFFLQLGCEMGVIALSFFAILLLSRIVHKGVYRRYVRASEVSSIADFATVTLVALIAYGAFNYIWADYAVYYLFWCVFGLESAALRISRREYDDRVDYYSDGRSSESSSVDISL